MRSSEALRESGQPPVKFLPAPVGIEAPFESWGRYPQAHQRLLPVGWRSDPLQLPEEGNVLAVGLGRSYGDSCLNDGGTLLTTRFLRRWIDFDSEAGVVRCEAGVSLEEILAVAVPRGWFLPVTPGTQFVTVGGAIANDVHGKNHHVAGTFGRFVRAFELLRSDGSRRVCSPTQNVELFSATIGGLGLTGLITWAEIALQPAPNAWVDTESIRFRNLEEFFALSAESVEWPYSVAWVDCFAKGDNLGRGLFSRGRHAAPIDGAPRKPATRSLSVPFDAPAFLLNGLTLRAFNVAYYRKQLSRVARARVHYRPFFYPLDAIHRWNRLYGKRGLLQWQCVVPTDSQAIRRILEDISRSGEGSFLAVLKTFGNVRSPGLLSFPRPGVTLALDFPNRGTPTFALLDRLDAIVREHLGALYPAKDARMSPETFRAGFPNWEKLAALADPRFSSSFWRRVTRLTSR